MNNRGSFLVYASQLVCLCAAFVCSGVWAEANRCPEGQYWACGEDPYDDSCTECDCEPCPPGETSDGSGVVYYCPLTYNVPSYGDNGCYTMVCQGYNDTCPSSVSHDRKCKRVPGCEANTGCQKYAVCNPVNGVIEYAVSGSCHLESSICYPNTRPCSEFNVSVAGGSGDWTCKKQYQTGYAYWMDEEGLYSYWRVDGCSCNKDALAVTTSGCAVGVVKHDLNSPTVPFATTPIPYTQTQRYCSKCVAGKIPQQTSTLSSGGVTFAPSSNSGWGSYSCKNVSKPKYSDDCTVRFDVGYTAAVAFCEKSCDSHMETKSDGAASADACLPDSTEYEDGIGKFTLGTDKCN